MKRMLLLTIFAITILSLNAQINQKYQSQQSNNETKNEESTSGFDKNKLTFGGGFGLQFGNYTLVNIAPQIGYNFLEVLNAGAGISYTYFKESFWINSKKWSEKRHYAGFNIYAKMYPAKNIVLLVQPEINNMWKSVESKDGRTKYSENKVVPSLILGGGIRLEGVTAMLQYDVIQDRNSPYGNNIFYSIGYTFNF